MNITFRQHEGEDHADPIVPRSVLLLAGAAMLASLIAANLHIGAHVVVPQAAVTATRLLSFADRADGAVVVTDAETNRLVKTLEPGSNAFIRASMRGLAHAGGGAVRPMRLTAYADGRLTLADDASQRTLDLEAFGSDNAAAYATLLTTEEHAP